MLKFEYITEIDVPNGTVRVNFTGEDVVSNPLPVSAPATKADKYSFPLSINEQVWCLMDENGEFGVVGGAIYSAKDKPPAGASANKITANINGKLTVEVDRANGKLKVENTEAGLKEIIQQLKDFIEGIKVNTPSGPSAGLITPTAAQLTDFQTKLDNLMT